MASDNELYSIGIVERDTGIGRDTLRVWERRYGYPIPERNTKGERAYTGKQLQRLQRIRRLMDQGMRPGKLLPLDEQALDELEAGLHTDYSVELDESVKDILAAIRSTDAGEVQSLLRGQLEKAGMKTFILEIVAPLLKAVGDAWATGKIEVFQEHFLSDQLHRFLSAEIQKMPVETGDTTVLLATLPGEEHTLGLLMIAGLLTETGVNCINLGAEVPMGQISRAVEQFQPDIVGITFSGAYPYNNIRPDLLELRELIPENIQLWTGGEGVRRLRKLPKTIRKFTSLDELPLTLPQ